jgi:DNA-binding XRE family transcriptional regulator
MRAARGLLAWSQAQLAETAGVARVSIKNIEKDITAPRKDTIEAIQKAFEDHGVEFLSGNGVRMKDEIITVYEGGDGLEDFKKLLDDIYQTMLLEGEGSEVLISGLEEGNPAKDPEELALVTEQIDRLTKIGVSERLLAREGDTNFSAPWHYYRWMPSEGFIPVPLYIYGSKIALSTDKPPYKSIVINNPLFAASCRHLFNFAWERSKVPPPIKD